MTCTVELNWQQQSVCSRLETGTTSQLMGNNMESGNSDQMYEGFLDSIHNTLQHNGSCDKPDLPWLLTTYVSTKKAGERRRRQREEGMSKLGFVWMDQQRSRYKDFSLYLHKVNTWPGTGQVSSCKSHMQEKYHGLWLLLQPHPDTQWDCADLRATVHNKPPRPPKKTGFI